MNQKFSRLPIFIGLYLIITGLSYFLFGKFLPINSTGSAKDTKVETGQITTTPKKTGYLTFEGPKTALCLINGEYFTEAEKKIWETRRPLMVMIENHADSRPQSGLGNADIVYEAMAEGGITRFMGVYYCNVVKGSPNKYDVGPVRSARSYFLDIASEYSDYPLYAHVGGANCSAPRDDTTGLQSGPCTTNKKAQAIEQISDYGWNSKGTWSDLSQFSLPYKACRREIERTGTVKDMEHTMYCSTTELWNIAADRGLTSNTEAKKQTWDKNFKSWNFSQKDLSSTSGELVKQFSFDFWGYKDYSVTWKYDAQSNRYLRVNGGLDQIDFNSDEQLSAKNIIIQFTKETRSVDTHGHNLYDMVGTGKGLLFQNGTKTDITWSKANRTSRTLFKDKSGKEVALVPGQTWVEVLAQTVVINYENIQ